MQGFLTPEQRSELLHELKVEEQAKYSDRIKVILLFDEGKRYKDISDYLFLDEGIICNYRKRYVKGGIFWLVSDSYSGKRCHLTDNEKSNSRIIFNPRSAWIPKKSLSIFRIILTSLTPSVESRHFFIPWDSIIKRPKLSQVRQRKRPRTWFILLLTHWPQTSKKGDGSLWRRRYSTIGTMSTYQNLIRLVWFFSWNSKKSGWT